MIKTFDFIKPTDYIYDNTKIQVKNGLRLISPYATDNPTVQTETFKAVSINQFTADDIISGSDNLAYIVNVDNQDYYYNSGWGISDGTYAQSNNEAELNTNIVDLITGTGVKDISLTIFLNSSGTTTPELTSVSFYGGLLTKRTVYGFINDSQDRPIANVKVMAFLPNGYYTYDGNQMLGSIAGSTFTDDNGYWELELMSNLDLTPNDKKYEFVFNGRNISKRETKRIPNTATEYNYNDL